MNKKGIIIRIVISIICLVGVGIGSYSLAIKTFNEDIVNKNNHDSSVIENTSSTDKECESCDNNVIISDDLSSIDFDELFLSKYVSISPEKIITSSDGDCILYGGSMYSTDISIEHKVSYILYNYLKANYNWNTTLHDYLIDGSDVSFKIKLDTLNTLISRYFANSKIKNSLKLDAIEDYAGKIECDSETCTISLQGGGGCVGPNAGGYKSKILSKIYNKETSNYEYVVGVYYAILGNNGVDVYTKENGEFITTVKYDMESDEEFNNATMEVDLYDSYANYLGDKLMTYKYIFNQNGQLVSVEKVN